MQIGNELPFLKSICHLLLPVFAQTISIFCQYTTTLEINIFMFTEQRLPEVHDRWKYTNILLKMP